MTHRAPAAQGGWSDRQALEEVNFWHPKGERKRYGLIAENLLERAFVASGLAPAAMIEGYAPAFARAIVMATERGIFDALRAGPLPAQAIAVTSKTHALATEKLLNLLVTMRYLKVRDGEYRLERHVRRWLLADGPRSIRDTVLMKRLEWRWIERLDSFIQDGQTLSVHEDMTAEDWGLYQRGMRSQANVLAPLLGRAIPVPAGARAMLDVGGSHGYFSVVLCRRHPGLQATVLDLLPAIQHAAPLLAREGMGDRVVLQAGNALTDDLGGSVYDLVLMFGLVHHFDDATNRMLVAKLARALRPAGTLVIGEPLRPSSPGKGDRSGRGLLRPVLRPRKPVRSVDARRDAHLAERRGPGAAKADTARFARRFGLQVADRAS